MPAARDAAPRGTRGMPRVEREAQILRAALEEFGEGGYHQTGMDAVAARAGVSKPLVHAYFGTKDALYARCAADVAERLLAAIVPVVEQAPPGVPMALETMRMLFATVRERPRDWLLVYDLTLPAGSEAEQVATAARERLTELGAQGVRAALAASPLEGDALDADAMNHVWQAVVTALMTWWFDHPEQTPERLTERFGRLLDALTASRG